MTKNQNQTTGPNATDAENNAPDAASATPEAPEATEATSTPETPEEPAEEQQAEGKGKGNREAANYRRQLRDTEAERDTLTETVDTLRKQIIAANMPHGAQTNSDALWATGNTPADFFNETGSIDDVKLNAAVKETHKTMGIHFGPDPINDSGKRDRSASTGITWADALQNKK